MISIHEEQGLDFDDVLLIPVNSDSNSRDLVDTSVSTEFFNLKIPIISSPMVGVSSVRLIVELGKLGGLGILPRFADMNTRRRQIKELRESVRPFGVAVGCRPEIQDREFNIIKHALDHGANLICIDTANGYSETVREFTSRIYKYYLLNKSFSLMVGNVVNQSGSVSLSLLGADIIRVGLGSGSVCTTRNVTGVGSAQLTAIQKTTTVYSRIVADGGIRNSGDAMKALAFGADFIMLGKLLAQTIESESGKELYGMASKIHQDNNGYKVKSVEGINISLNENEKIPLKDFIDRFMYGIKSGCTYLGIKRLSDIANTNIQVQKVNNSIKPWKQEWL